MPDDMQTFRTLAEKCFKIKRSIQPPAYQDVPREGRDIRIEYPPDVWDNLAAWALLADMEDARVCRWSIDDSKRRYLCESPPSRISCTGETRHEAIARCWLAANGVDHAT